MAYSVLSYRILKNEQTLVGSTIQREQVVRIFCVCDTVADLPPIDLVTVPEGTMRLAAGSRAHIIATSADYMLDSAGNWIQQLPPSAAATYSKQEIDAMIQDIDDNLADLQLDIHDLRQDNATDRSVLADLIDTGAKNLLEMTHASGSITRYGVTCTWDTDAGTMTFTGAHAAADSAAIFEFYSGNAVDQKVIPTGEYHLSGVPAGGSTATYRAVLIGITGGVDTGNGADFTLSEPHYAAYRILISGECDFTGGMTFRPMICTQDAWTISQQFVPYVPTLSDLYKLVKSYHP